MNKKITKIFSIIFLFLICFNFCNVYVYADINEEYANGGELPSIDLEEDKVIESSPITNYLGSFIFTVGVLVETVTSNLMSLVSGDKAFPWADKIIFNAIPLLDVNFINPHSESLLSLDNGIGIGEVIRNIYFTGLSLALGFLGIVIAVMAIKLALSTIGSEKAKYKEAIVKWLTSLILLFGMHFVISFLFYMNEEMVVVASKILGSTISENSEKLEAVVDQKLNENKQKIVLNFCNKAVSSEATSEAMSWLNPIGWISNGAKWVYSNITGDKRSQLEAKQANVEYLFENYEITYALINNKDIKEYVLPYVSGNSENSWLKNATHGLSNIVVGLFGVNPVAQEVDFMASAVRLIKNDLSESRYNDLMNELKADLSKDKDSTEYKSAKVMQVIYTYQYQYSSGSLNKKASNQIIGELGEYFKTNAWYTDVEKGDWSPSRASVVGATLYTMFVFQSIMFFMAYIKRFFYVVILAVIAPFVVIYDFFTKSMSI